MKTSLVWILLLWFAITVEQSNLPHLPSQALLLPMAVGCAFWLKNATGLLLSGSSLTLLWILFPTSSPFAVVSVVTLSAGFLTHDSNQQSHQESRTTWWYQPTLVLLTALLCHAGNAASVADVRTAFLSRALIAIPILLFIVFLARFAEELRLPGKPIPPVMR